MANFISYLIVRRHRSISSGSPEYLPVESESLTTGTGLSKYSGCTVISFITMFSGVTPTSLVRFVPIPYASIIFPCVKALIFCTLSTFSASEYMIVFVRASIPSSLYLSSAFCVNSIGSPESHRSPSKSLAYILSKNLKKLSEVKVSHSAIPSAPL